MRVADIYAAGFAFLAAWGVFSGAAAFKAAGAWSARRWQMFLVGALFTGSAAACALGLLLGWFRAWLLVPLGVSFLAMLPLPCYFAAVDRIGWLHAARNLLFMLIALLCFALGARLLPLPWGV